MRNADSVAERVRVASRESQIAGILAGSAVLKISRRVFTPIVRSLSGRMSFIGQRLARRAPTREFGEAIHVVTSSALYRAVESLGRALGPAAWASSTVGRLVSRHWGEVSAASKVRLLGWLVVVATVARALVAPQSLLQSGIGLTSWVVLLAFGTCLFVLSPSIAAAWAHYARDRS